MAIPAGFQELLAYLDDVLAEPSPESAPYASAYRVIEIIQKLLTTTINPVETALAKARLGATYLQVEEPHNAQPALEEAGAVFFPDVVAFAAQEPFSDGDKEWTKSGIEAAIAKLPSVAIAPVHAPFTIQILELLNQLGILWSNRSLFVRALCFFQACQKACAMAIDGSLADPDALAGVYTHTHFYLAQIYGNLQLPDESARHCLRTLELQLNAVLSASGGKASAIEWMANCLRLVDYYLDTSNGRDASSCLFASECVYSKTYPKQEEPGSTIDEEEIETQQRTHAEIASGWAKVHQLTLQLAQFPDQIKFDIPSQTQSLERILCDNNFGTLDTSSVVLGMHWVAPQKVTSFEDARDVFKQGTRASDQAKTFFVLDGFVTEHVRLLLLQSRLYKRLVYWETDQKRQIAMELRRMAIVTPLLGDQLNPSAYTALLQELYFEGAEIASEVYDIKLKKSEKRDEKTNAYALKAIHCYQQYLRFFYSPPPASVTGGNNVRLPSNEMTPGEVRTLLLGFFALARMCGKVYFPKDKEKTLSCWTSSLGFHEAVPALVQKYQDLQSNAGTTNGQVLKQMFEGELAICHEMLELLPEKINQLAYNGRAVLA